MATVYNECIARRGVALVVGSVAKIYQAHPSYPSRSPSNSYFRAIFIVPRYTFAFSSRYQLLIFLTTARSIEIIILPENLSSSNVNKIKLIRKWNEDENNTIFKVIIYSS